MDEALSAALARALGSRVAEASPVGGGDINQALRVRLADGTLAFVKTHPAPPPGMYALEAEGLSWLAEAGALRVPTVLAHRDEAPAFLALEWIASAGAAPAHDEALGHGLAALHRFGAPGFGLDRNNFIAVLPQPNAGRPDWASFYYEQRLLAQLAVARREAGATAAMERGFERLGARIGELVGPAEPPARLHGDLWGGNAMTDEHGAPVLIDPAVYGGHREIDLAMMRLFGGFSARCFAAYEEAYPLTAGHRERVALYQLYPLMVHVNLFGGGYGRRVESILDALV